MTCCEPITDPDERARLLGYLRKAEDAYNTFMTGGQVAAFTDQNGERVEYRAANRGNLLMYINQLRAQLGMPPMSFCGLVSSPMGVFL